LTASKAAVLGGAIGLAISFTVLVLLWFRVSEVLFIGNVDCASVLWPSFFMITTTWRTTVPGLVITASSIAINSLVYAALAVAFRALILLRSWF
jgi:hypothetical protein